MQFSYLFALFTFKLFSTIWMHQLEYERVEIKIYRRLLQATNYFWKKNDRQQIQSEVKWFSIVPIIK